MAVSTVLHINTADNQGGAARSGYRIHSGLKSLGLTSRMFVRTKGTSDPDIKTTNPFPLLYFADKAFEYLWTYTGWQYLYFPSSYRLLNHRWFREADVVQLFNIHGNFFTPRVLPRISETKPIVWRLSDMWPMTGHCAYSYDCDRWKTGCGSCPLLDEYPPLMWDRTASLWKMKKAIYDKSHITLIAPSRWIARLAAESPLLGRFPVHAVPNGIDANTFQPADKAKAKESWGLPAGLPVVLLQDMGPGGHRKGRAFLPQIINALQNRFQGSLSFLVFGGGSLEWNQRGIPNLRATGTLSGNENLSRLYNAADLFVFPTLAENLANVALETMASGVPVVSFNAGGMPDLIKTEDNGLLVEAGNVSLLVEAAAVLIRDAEKRAALGRKARETIVQEFTQELEAKRVLAVYEDALGRFKKQNG